MIIKVLKFSMLAWVFALLSLVNVTQAQVCEYEITSEWDTGFVASVSLTNTENEPISDWSVTWNFYDFEYVVHSWAADLLVEALVVMGPESKVTATAKSWNQLIQPAQTIEFGFIGSKPSGSASPVLDFSGNCVSKEIRQHQTLLNENMALWASYEFDVYQIVYGFWCGLCPYPGDVLIDVENELITGLEYRDTGEPIPLDSNWPERLTVSELFAVIQRAIDYDYDTVTVSYDEVYGYPTNIFLDPSASSFDDQTRHEIFEFIPL